MPDKIFQDLKNILPEVEKNVLLKKYTTFKTGGPAKYFFVAKTKEDLILAVKTAKKMKLQFFILGSGSNILFSDKGFCGLVIKIQIAGLEKKQNKIVALSGTKLSNLISFAKENNFSGFEWVSGIPGTVGGAIFGNAQAFGCKISDNIESIEALDSKTLKIINFSKKQCKFSLKDSIFKTSLAGRKNLIIISAVFSLVSGTPKKIQEKITEYTNFRKNNQPLNFPSAGSIFINPETNIKNRKLLEKYPELIEFNKKGVIPAGYLIERSGLKGKKIGGAQISEKHANFIINKKNAKSKDVLKLISLVEKKIKKSFGVILKPEIIIIGFDK
jgi:UDP-N-acetylmuramate dehydrogenase